MATPRDAFGRFIKTGGGGKPVRRVVELTPLFRAAIAEVVRRIELRAFQALTSATPVDLGTARSGWTPSVGSAIEERITGTGDDTADRQAAAARLSENTAKARQIAETYLLSQGKAFITNPVPWIVPLNEGSSSQAPSKFVERAIDTALRSL